MKSFLLKSTVFRASHWNPLFHARLLTGFLLLEDRGKPSDLDICTVTQYLSIFTKHFIGFRKREKYWRKISRKVKLEDFAQIHGLPGFPLKSFVSWRASNGLPFVRRPSDLDICAVTQYLTIFGKHFIDFRKREKYGRKVSRKMKLKVFSSNPRSSGLPIEILCFMRGS